MDFTVDLYIGLKDDLDGNLDIKEDWKLQFYDTSDIAQVSNKCTTYTQSQIKEEKDVKVWNKSKHMVSSTDKNAELTGISEKLIQQDGNSLKAVYGNSKNKYQAVFLYVIVPDPEDIETPPPGGGEPRGTIPKPPDPNKNEEVLEVPTNVTIMYFEKDGDSTPIKIEQETISRKSTYTVVKTGNVDGNIFELKKWVIIDDENPGVPENYTWKEAEKHKSKEEDPGESDSPGDLGPHHWSKPNRELFIKYVKRNNEETSVINAKIDHLLTEKRITKGYTLRDHNYKIPEYEFHWDVVDGYERDSCESEECEGHDCYEKISDGHLLFTISNLSKVNSVTMGNETYFKPYDINNYYEFNRGMPEGDYKISNPDYGYVVWRGRDIPTIATYKYDGKTFNSAANKDNYEKIKNLIPEGKVPLEQRHKENGHDGGKGMYKDGFNMLYGIAKKDTGLDGHDIKEDIRIGDYSYSTHWTYCGKEQNHGVERKGDSVDIQGGVQVDVGYGRPNIGDEEVTFLSENLNAFGIEFNNILGYPINNQAPIKLYPYVEMLFDTTTGLEDQNVMVLGGHESTLLPRDYIEIGYKTKAVDSSNRTGLIIDSKQWSTHTAAKKLGPATTVLPGGAIFSLKTPITNGENTRTVVGMSSWLTFLPEDTINYVTAGNNEYSLQAQIDRNEELYRQVLNSFNNLDIVQYVNNEKVLYENRGSQRISGTSGQADSADDKYWLKQNLEDGAGWDAHPNTIDDAIKVRSTSTNEADLDVVEQKEERIYYRVYSDIEGNVCVSKGNSVEGTASTRGTVLGKISKEESLDDLLEQDTEIKALNNRTNIVTNYINFIDRNIGNDTSVSDSRWYNEAWDGICVVRVNKYMEIGFKDTGADSATRTSALDPKFCPPLKNQSDLYSKKVTSWFQSEAFTNAYHPAKGYSEGHVGTFTNVDGDETAIILDKMDGLYRTKDFYIPNVTVMNLY